MRKNWPAVLLVSLSMATPLFAQDTTATTQAGQPSASAEAAVGTSVVDRALQGEATTFKAADTQKLYCFSRVTGAADSDVEHVWYHAGQEVGRVKLHVGGSPWRTHSSKTLDDDAAGDWRCDVVLNGKVLQSVSFKVE
jgi:hypothetical protein